MSTQPELTGPGRPGSGPEQVEQQHFTSPQGDPVDSFSFDTPRDPHWYKRALFYEVNVRSFQDSTGNGTGDLRGLPSRLDYLQWLGIDCIWLLPIYQSPLRDGGYDIP